MPKLRDMCAAGFLSLLATIAIILSLSVATAQVMSSSNYRIQQDSVNLGGGLGTSTNFTLESTGGEVATGDAESSTYKLRAGYQQLDSSFIGMSVVPPVTLSPSIAGLSGGTSNGSTSVTVTTDSPAGYELFIAAVEDPAMQSALYTIPDYEPLGANPDFSFVTVTAESRFGFTPSGVDIVNRFRDNGGSCGVGALDTALACWDGLSLTDTVVARGSGPNVPSGTVTSLHFRVEVGAAALQPSGVYTATTTLTALSL
jgi:hypothetical protein